MSDSNDARVVPSEGGKTNQTSLARVRTQFAMMRTGFTIASFGAGITEFLGRGNWPDWATNSLTAIFVIAGMMLVQVTLVGTAEAAKDELVGSKADRVTRFAVRIVPWMLQAGLLGLLLIVLLH